MGWLDALNERQLEAASFGAHADDGRFEAGPMLVIAGAGTGKTSTIAHRVAHLVVCGVDPARILLMTFSRRAAAEMTHRAQRIAAQALVEASGSARGVAQSGVRLPWAGTFHSIGARLLRIYAQRIGLAHDFVVLDRGDAADLIDLIRHEQGLSEKAKRFPRKDTCLAIYSYRVNTGWPLERVLSELYPWCADWADELRGLFREYVARKQSNGVLDYDDLLLWWDAAMSDAPFAREVGARFDHVLVDEYQDTNLLQARILHAMKPDGRGLVVVGDDAQSIYSFRAADVGNILEFPERFSPPAHRVTLELNYRSVQPVLDAANALIGEGARQYPKHLHAARGAGARPRLVTVLDERAQVDWVVAEVLRQREAGVALKRQAVLFRSGHHSDLLEVELTRRNIPYVKHGGLRFLEAGHVKDLLAVLRWAENPRNTIAAFRALQLMSGMGPANAQRCIALFTASRDARGTTSRDARSGARSHAALRDFTPPAAAAQQWPDFVAILTQIAAPDARWAGQVERVREWYLPILAQRHDDAPVRAADLDMLATIATQFGSRERFLTELALDPPNAAGDLAGDPLRDEDYLILSTVHSAKGQEWDAVYLINVADGNFPNEYATGKLAAIEEERRLLYVAMTRARDTLQLVEPQRYYVTHQPRLGAGYVHGARSRFLTPAVLACLDRGRDAAQPPVAPVDGEAAPQRTRPESGTRSTDIGARLRAMW